MEIVLGILGGVSFLFIWAGLTRPKGIERPQATERPDQYRLKQLRGAGVLARAVEDVSAWFTGRASDDEARWGGVSARYLVRLKQADWYWAPGEPAPPSADAPFWNLETLWASKVLHAVLFGLGGLVVGGVLALVYRWSPVVPLAAGLGLALVGFMDPDSELAEAAEKRRRQIVLEMGYKVPELRVYVRSGRTFVAALRYLTNRPGGPFVRELYRALRVYDVAGGDLERGVRAVMEHNALCEPLVNLCGDLLAVIAEGGELGVVLEAHADTAQHEQRRQLRQQGQDNTQQMSLVVAGTTLVVLMVLAGGPALWQVLTALGGM